MDLPGTGPGTVFIGTARVELHLPAMDSLKGKRSVMNRLKATVQNELGASVAEVGYQELWQRAAVGIAAVASSATGAQRVVDRVTAIIERDHRVIVTRIEPDVWEVD